MGKSRIGLPDYAFQAARMCDCCAESSGLREKGSLNEGFSFYQSVDLWEMLLSLVVVVFILNLPRDRINLARIATGGSEYLFDVTRVRRKGNNGDERIRRQMARAMVLKRIGERNALYLGDRRKVNLSGTADDVTAGDLPILCGSSSLRRLPAS
jgi:hypothetical protein